MNYERFSSFHYVNVRNTWIGALCTFGKPVAQYDAHNSRHFKIMDVYDDTIRRKNLLFRNKKNNNSVYQNASITATS